MKDVVKGLFYLVIVFSLSFSCFAQQNPDILYENFTKTYDSLDAVSIANLYVENAEVLNLYDGGNSNSLKGKKEIEKYYQDFFSRIKSNNQKLRLTFKIINRRKEGNVLLDNGFYKLEFSTENKPSFFGFGKFSTVLTLEDSVWKFKTDATTNTDFIDYENAITPIIPKRNADSDDILYAPFYDNLLGTYQVDDELITIGRSLYRLYAYYEKTNQYRGLTQINATTWTVGKTILSDEVEQTYKFNSDKLEMYENEKLIKTALKKPFYVTENVTYSTSKGVKLGGTLFIPKKSNGKAIVLVHGSGAQDRNGYASIIRLIADIFARNGITVLTYDKQGVEQSEGNWQIESFEDLASDALAGIDFLKLRKELEISKIGLGGSSQAGWVIAKAIQEQQNKVDFALTIAAAGSGISVVEQNLYNTEMVLKCDGSFSEKQISAILTQQKYFFDYLNNPKTANKLDQFTKKIQKDSKINDWLFPTSEQVDLTTKDQWFTALEVNFNPLSSWQKYDKPVLMTFSEFDDSTPALRVKTKVDNLKKQNIQTVFFSNTQHIGLKSGSMCEGGISKLSQFDQNFFDTMITWIQSL